MSTLEKIVKIKREKINLLKSSNNFTDHFITNNTKQYKQSFFDNLRNSTDKYKIIAEIKKGSPSAGIILDDFDPLLCAKQYIEKGYKNLKKALIVSSKDGIDELSVTSNSDVYELKNGEINSYEINPLDYGLSIYDLSEIQVNSLEEAHLYG